MRRFQHERVAAGGRYMPPILAGPKLAVPHKSSDPARHGAESCNSWPVPTNLSVTVQETPFSAYRYMQKVAQMLYAMSGYLAKRDIRAWFEMEKRGSPVAVFNNI